MGYTHYWTQPKDYTVRDWKQIGEDIGAILKDVQHVQGIALAWEYDQPGKQPEIGTEVIRFNGLGEDGHETFHISRERPDLQRWQTVKGSAFCKTARKPYDIAVVACLAYLAALEKKPWRVSSDGNGREWLEGVGLARRCVPRMANQIDIPMPIMKGDRWDWRLSPCGHVSAKHYDVRGCIDGAAYAFDVRDETKCYRFPTAQIAKDYLATFHEKPCTVTWSNGQRFKEPGGPLFNASGSFDGARHARIEREQTRILKALIDSAASESRNIPPPAYARPNEMPGVTREQETLADLYRLCV